MVEEVELSLYSKPFDYVDVIVVELDLCLFDKVVLYCCFMYSIDSTALKIA